MKGLLLAGGKGTRLHPMTLAVSKQLIPVYNKPMVFYPLCTLMFAGATDIRLVCSPNDENAFTRLLGDGSHLGLNISYGLQMSPGGIPQALSLSASFVNESPVCLALGDNIFYGSGVGESLSQFKTTSGATVLAQQVSNPENYGVVEFNSDGYAISLEEKPELPRSKFAVPGLYFYDSSACERAAQLSPSPRGETEITDLNRSYLDEGKLAVRKLPRGTAWLDTGTVASLNQAAEFVKAIENRQGLLVGSPEEVAWRLGLIDDAQLDSAVSRFGPSEYGHYLRSLIQK